jgi:hypothetical protein
MTDLLGLNNIKPCHFEPAWWVCAMDAGEKTYTACVVMPNRLYKISPHANLMPLQVRRNDRFI